MWPCPEDHPGGETSLPSHFSFLHTQRGPRSARLSLSRRGDVFTPWYRWCHFHAPYKGLSGFKCNTLVEHNVHPKEPTYNIFLSCLQFDLSQWLNEAHPVFSERTRLLELVHGALCVCGQDPEPELQTPFHLFTKHWAWLLRHHFPDHYSDCLRLLMTSKSVSECMFTD